MEKHRLEKELLELVQQGKFSLLSLDGIVLDGMWYWDLENPEEEWMSPTLWTTLGFDPATKKHLVSEWQDLIFPEDLEVAISNFEKHCADPSHPYDQIVRYRHADGSTVWVRCRGVAIRDETGKPIRLLGFHIDLTPLILAKDQAISRLNEFTYIASHDLREPARTISNFVNMLVASLGNNLTAQTSNLVKFITSATDRLLNMLDGLLDISRMDRLEHTLVPCDIHSSTFSVLSSLSAQIEEKGAIINVQSHENPPPRVVAHCGLIESVVQNLIANALKYHKKGEVPEVSISWTQENGCVLLSIEDRGIGMREEDLSKIFQIFQRLHGTSRDETSVGLGLYLAKKAAIKMNGDLQVSSVLGQGSIFTLSLPIASQEDEKEGEDDQGTTC